MTAVLIADSGATKTEWSLTAQGRRETFSTQGLSPYFFTTEQIADILNTELVPFLQQTAPTKIFYYGTGCARPENARIVSDALTTCFPGSNVEVQSDLMAAARAVCGRAPGVACILGTGSNSCFYDGTGIVKNSPGLGYVLGDEGSGAILGKKVIQYYLYDTYDEDLRSRFDAQFVTTPSEIIDNVYKKPLANRYLASFALFLANNRGHYMIENIIEDGLNEFFFQHLNKYAEVWTSPVSFVGSIAFGFRDVIKELCNSYEFELGAVLKNPMPGLETYHFQEP